MNLTLINEIHQLNPWLNDPSVPILDGFEFFTRVQSSELLEKEWDNYWSILTGPRRAGKTTLGRYLSQQLINSKRFSKLLYLNCDYLSIRQWLKSPLFISEALEEFELLSPIILIDEVQRVENPGLLLKAIIDLQLPLKLIATGSSQLEIKSKVKEFLTGRQLTATIYPLSHEEWPCTQLLEQRLIYGSYPQIIKSSRQVIQLTEIYNRYIQKDIIEILKIGNPDVFQQLITLVAYQSGQLVNYNQLASDCRVSVTMIRNHLDILEQTFVIQKVKPFVGNKRTEITANPIYYFIDNGFRNVALRNFSPLSFRTDSGLLVEGFVFQELLKYRAQHFLDYDIHYWRTKSGAEVDFILYANEEQFIPIEVKFRTLNKPTIPRGFRSFIQAYQPKQAIMITKELSTKASIENCLVHFIPLEQLSKAFKLISEIFIA